MRYMQSCRTVVNTSLKNIIWNGGIKPEQQNSLVKIDF